jgi:N-acetylgalactosamine-N,N'-diacetylbacillosaminyl-diphospho-undecaprenol 4-alpha-N-acetylgalactosaminyltransferase
MKKDKLSFIISSLSDGGAERQVSILINQLKDKYSIKLFLFHTGIFYKYQNSVKVVYLGKSDSSEFGILKFLKIFILAWRLKKLNSSKITFSFLNRPNYINILAKIYGMKSKVVINERTMPSIQHSNNFKGFINKRLIKLLYKKADIVITNSKGNAEDLTINFNINRVITINNSVDLNEIAIKSKEIVSFRDNAFSFITIGRLDYGKNHLLLLEAMKEINAKLYIIGDGVLKGTIIQKIREYRLSHKVKLLGRKKNPFRYLDKADCFVFSSNYEGFPNVIIEALACGLPVISTDCKSGPREILAPFSKSDYQINGSIELAKYGILTPINDKNKLVEAMNVIIKHKILRDNYSLKGLKRVKRYGSENVIKQYDKIICAVYLV